MNWTQKGEAPRRFDGSDVGPLGLSAAGSFASSGSDAARLQYYQVLKKTLRLGLAVLGLWTAFAAGAQAQETSMALLQMPVDARALSLGDGVAALDNGVNSMADNPAGLAHLSGKELGTLYGAQMDGMNMGFLAYAQNTPLGTLGVSYLTLLSGSIDGRNDAGIQTGSFHAQDSAIGLSYGRGFGGVADGSESPVRVGVNAKYVNSTIGSYSASAFAADLGAQASVNSGDLPLTCGLVMRNIGSGLRYADVTEPLPLSTTLALSAKPQKMFQLSAGVTQSWRDHQTQGSVGVEITPFNGVALRGSWGLSRAGLSGQTQVNLSGGIGLRLSLVTVDYAMAPMGDLGMEQRLNLTFRFGGPRAGAEAPTLGTK